MEFDTSINLPSANQMIEELGLQERGPVQQFFTNEIWRLADEYVPMDSGNLKNDVIVEPDKIIYSSIYAKYQWYANLMVDPQYLVGAFPITKHGIINGFYSRPGVPKIMDPEGRKINNFNGLRGPYWAERMWADRQNEIIASVQEYLKNRK
mgnify:CR=1 FL=1